MYNEIKECMICKSNLTQVLDLGMQFVVDFPKAKDETLLKAPLVLMKCTKCNLIQLKHAVSGERLYKKFWYRSGINEQMRDELLAIVQKASEIVELQNGDKVLDIGCNDGTLLGWYGGNVTTVGIDPCKELVEEGMQAKRMDIGISDFFSADVIKDIYKATGITGSPKFKIITSVAMFYDLPDPVQFLKDCKELMHDQGVLVIQMNYLVNMLKDTAFDFISHEHRAIYSLMTLQVAVEAADLTLQGVELSRSNGGSIRAFVTHNENNHFYASDVDARSALYQNMQLLKLTEMRIELDTVAPYVKFEKDIQTKMEKLRKFIGALDVDGKRVYVYGASTRGTALMQYLFKDSVCNLRGVAERDPNKFGRVMVGTWLPIMDEASVRSKADYMLCLPWHFRESIIKRESAWLDKGGVLLFPLPNPHVASAPKDVPEFVSQENI